MEAQRIVSTAEASMSGTPIADASFPNFLGELFAGAALRDDDDRSYLQGISMFSLETSGSSLKSLSNERATDDDGIYAEISKYGSMRLQKYLLKSFNFISRTSEGKDAWHVTTSHMLPKNSDLTKASH